MRSLAILQDCVQRSCCPSHAGHNGKLLQTQVLPRPIDGKRQRSRVDQCSVSLPMLRQALARSGELYPERAQSQSISSPGFANVAADTHSTALLASAKVSQSAPGVQARTRSCSAALVISSLLLSLLPLSGALAMTPRSDTIPTILQTEKDREQPLAVCSVPACLQIPLPILGSRPRSARAGQQGITRMEVPGPTGI